MRIFELKLEYNVNCVRDGRFLYNKTVNAAALADFRDKVKTCKGYTVLAKNDAILIKTDREIFMISKVI